MPDQQPGKRSYGFSDRPDMRTSRSYGEADAERQEPAQKTTLKRPSRLLAALLLLLILPFKLLGWILKGLWTLWKKRPRLKKRTKQELRRRLFWTGLSVAVISFLGGTILVAWASKDLPDPDRLTDRRIAQSTKIYDRSGEHLLY